jgi:hypothetical protein
VSQELLPQFTAVSPLAEVHAIATAECGVCCASQVVARGRSSTRRGALGARRADSQKRSTEQIASTKTLTSMQWRSAILLHRGTIGYTSSGGEWRVSGLATGGQKLRPQSYSQRGQVRQRDTVPVQLRGDTQTDTQTVFNESSLPFCITSRVRIRPLPLDAFVCDALCSSCFSVPFSLLSHLLLSHACLSPLLRPASYLPKGIPPGPSPRPIAGCATALPSAIAKRFATDGAIAAIVTSAGRG